MREGYGQFCPVAKALEMVGSRWTPLVLRELLAGGRHFSDLRRGVPLMSRTLLAQRLKELEQDGLLVATEKDRGRGHEYRLTAAGVAMEPVLAALVNGAPATRRHASRRKTAIRRCCFGQSVATATAPHCPAVALSSASSSATCRQGARA
jgi:DNA-binding HxlR family transcriptional regulator